MKNRLRGRLRVERNWSQADLAERLEVSRQSVNAIETGKFDPSLPLAFKLARLFGLRLRGFSWRRSRRHPISSGVAEENSGAWCLNLVEVSCLER